MALDELEAQGFRAQVRDSKETVMRLFNEQREFYCGIDLHANSMQVCAVDRQGKKADLQKHFPNSGRQVTAPPGNERRRRALIDV